MNSFTKSVVLPLLSVNITRQLLSFFLFEPQLWCGG